MSTIFNFLFAIRIASGTATLVSVLIAILSKLFYAWRDYRESVISMTLIPIGWFRHENPTDVIWYGLQNSMAAFQDPACEERLQ